MRHPFLRLALLLALGLTTVTAHAADNKAVAKDAYLEGQRLFELGEYQKALDSFKRAYLAFDDPAFLFNLGQCYRMIGDKPEAVRSYKQYLRKVPNAGNRGAIEKIVSELETAIEQDRTSRTRPPEGVQAPNGETATPPPTGESAAPAPPATATAATATTGGERRDKPLYKKWWLWTIVGGVVVAGVAVGLGVGLTAGKGAPNNNTTLPDIGPNAHAAVRLGVSF